MITEQPQSSWIINWLKESITVKLAFIAILTLLLLIPSFMVDNLINERAQRQAETINTIADQWSGSQLIQGPVLMIPYKRSVREFGSENKETIREVIEHLFILPEELDMNASLDTKMLYRGIYQASVYSTRVKINGSFLNADLAKAGLTREQLLWDKAKITFSITDLKGLQTNPEMTVGDKRALAEPAMNEKGLFSNGLQCSFDLSASKDRTIPFNFVLDLKGSQELHFLHLGKTTKIEASGNWNSPSFDGRYLPDDRKITETGFTAKWRMLYYNRPFPQQWTADDTLINSMQKHQDAIFGVKLRLPVDEYQKTIRTSKYAILIVLLTFISLFLTELIGKKKIHSFNYILIGAAMIIYYILLLSFCEQVGYNMAYAIASVATVGLITTFIASLLNNTKAAIIFSLILSVFYAFIFVIIQLEDLALLVGSIALFIIIASLMYFSRKINWDKY